MNHTHTLTRARSVPGKQGQRRRYWSGFSVCLFIVLLSVFTWAMHRRLTQYESIGQSGGHHMTATKVCLTERPQISIPSVQTMDKATMFFVAIVFAGALFRLDDSPKSPGLRHQSPYWRQTRIKQCVAYFFFLPPPAAQTAL